MGLYINQINGAQLPAKGKAQYLIDNAGATTVNGNQYLENMVCVVENYFFDAAAYLFSEHEYRVFLDDDSGRNKTWLVVPDANIHAK